MHRDMRQHLSKKKKTCALEGLACGIDCGPPVFALNIHGLWDRPLRAVGGHTLCKVKFFTAIIVPHNEADFYSIQNLAGLKTRVLQT